MMKVAFLCAIAGHLLCALSDFWLTVTPQGGRFTLASAKEPGGMRRLFEGMPPKRLIHALLLGVLGLCLSVFGYLAAAQWMEAYSGIAAVTVRTAGLVFAVFITAHHVACVAAEWFYVRMDRTEDALKTAADFFMETIPAMAVGYLALGLFSAVLLWMIAGGKTALPRWGAFLTPIPLYLLMTPLKVPAKGNLCSAVLFLFLFFLL